jgi:ABC-2 type transport system permease protein
MPIHDLGYRAWNGARSGQLLRWTVVAQNGFARAWNSRWLRRLLIFAWIPATYFGAVFFLYERAMLAPQNQRSIQVLQRLAPDNLQDDLARITAGNAAENRHYVWSGLLFTFFRYPQATLMVLVVGLVAPALIARDVASKAFLVYFSRPISRLEYILGKSATVWGYLLLITTAPALALYVLAVALSPSVKVVLHTWDVPLRVLGASVVLIVPTTAIALAFSSLTRRAVTAGFLWYAVWVLGAMAFFILQANEQRSRVLQYQQAQHEQLGQGFEDPHQGAENWPAGLEEGRVERPKPEPPRWTFVSLFHTLGLVQRYIFDPGTGSAAVAWSAVSLAVLTVVSVLITYWRVSSPMRV